MKSFEEFGLKESLLHRLKKKGIYEEGNFSLYILKVVITLIILGGLYHFVPEMIRKLQLF